MVAATHFSATQQSVVLFRLNSNALFLVEGHDALRYLHGRVTQDLKTLAAGTGALTLTLTASGKIQGQFIVLKTENDLLILLDPSNREELQSEVAAAILQFKVADDVRLVALKDDFSFFSFQGPRSGDLLKTLGVANLPVQELNHFFIESSTSQLPSGTRVISNSRGNQPGFDLMVPKATAVHFLNEVKLAGKNLGLEEGDEESYQLLRILSGRPQFGSDLSEKVTASDIDLTKLVSFTKGCYAGQEVVEMASARGRANKRFVAFLCSGKVSPGDEIETSTPTSANDTTRSGVITSAAHYSVSNVHVALGFIKNQEDSQLNYTANNFSLKLLAPDELRQLQVV